MRLPKKIDSSVLLNSRLSPDIFALARQVQIATDQAKNGSARLAGIEAPRYEDNEMTMDQLKARVAKTVAYLRRSTQSRSMRQSIVRSRSRSARPTRAT
jgi:hypothetical protein